MKKSAFTFSMLLSYSPLIILAVGGLYIYRTYFKTNPLDISNKVFEDLSKGEAKSLSENVSTSLGTSTTVVSRVKNAVKAKKLVPNSSHLVIANTLQMAMQGGGTKENKFEVIRGMHPDTLMCVFEAYGIRSVYLGMSFFPVVGNLLEHMENDLSDSEYAEYLKYFKKAKIA